MKYKSLRGHQEVRKKQVKQFLIHLILTGVLSMGWEEAFSVRKILKIGILEKMKLPSTDTNDSIPVLNT